MYRSYITLKYLFSRPFTVIGATGAVALGTLILIVVQAVMGGFRVELRKRIRGTLSHVTVEDHRIQSLANAAEIIEAAKRLEPVEAAAPYLEALCIFRRYGVQKCAIRGIDPAGECEVSDLRSYIVRPEDLDRYTLQFLEDRQPIFKRQDHRPVSVAEVEELFSLEWRQRLFERLRRRSRQPIDLGDRIPQALVVGTELMSRLHLLPGNTVNLVTVSLQGEEFQIRQQTFIVTGAFQTNNFDYDANYAYAHIAAVKEFVDSFDRDLDQYLISGVSIKLDDYNLAEEAKQLIGDETSDISKTLLIQTWEDKRKNLLRAVNVEKAILRLLLVILVPFAGTIIALILTLLVIEKTRDLGILLSLGATPAGIVTIFLLNGLAICLTGLGAGFVGGVILCRHLNSIHDWVQNTYNVSLFPPDIYYLEKIPVHLSVEDVAWVIVPMVIVAFLASLFPAVRAARRDPIHSLRYE